LILRKVPIFKIEMGTFLKINSRKLDRAATDRRQNGWDVTPVDGRLRWRISPPLPKS
jgi:hypothetical protein